MLLAGDVHPNPGPHPINTLKRGDKDTCNSVYNINLIPSVGQFVYERDNLLELNCFNSLPHDVWARICSLGLGRSFKATRRGRKGGAN